MVDVEAGQIYACVDNVGGREHVLVLEVEERDWARARALIYIFEKDLTLDVHARTLWRIAERVA